MMNLMENLPADLESEAFDVLVDAPHVRIERIVSRGHCSAPGDWYDQDRDEWVMVVKGRAVLAFEGEAPRRMEAGDHVLVPAHARHRVEWTDPDRETIWLAVHYG